MRRREDGDRDAVEERRRKGIVRRHELGRGR